MIQTLSTSEKVKEALKQQGRKQNWLASQMNLNPQTISNKLKSNEWSVIETIALQKILNID